jgi:hypothetical protein
MGEAEAEVGEITGKFDGYPEKYKEPVDYSTVAGALKQADEVGRSRAYVENLREVKAVEDFYEDEKDELRKAVAGACQYTAKQAGCTGEVGGAAAGALDRAMKERLKERLHEGSDAQRIVDRHRTQLGPENAAALEEHVDEVSRAAFLAYIEMVEHKVRLERYVEEASAVKSAADDLIEEEKKFQKLEGLKDEDIKASQERVAAMEEAKGRMDASVDRAKQMLQDVEERISKLQKKYDKSFDKLMDDLEKRAKDAPKKTKAEASVEAEAGK